MKVLVINCGSSSLKYTLFEMVDESVLATGKIERIGKGDVPNHNKAFEIVIDNLTKEKTGVIKDKSEISAIGHRVVHGGDKYSESVTINDEVIKDIEKFSIYAPLHNPANLIGIKLAMKFFPDIPHVAVFDTAFHYSMPEYSYLYGIPYELAIKHGVRRYGFHGTSHHYVAQRTAIILGKPLRGLKIITCHIGAGSSITAVLHGKSIDTSMGMTPLQGVIMGTRCGTIDPSIVELLMEKEGLDFNGIIDLLNKKSGLVGISGISADFRDLLKEAENGNKRAKLAIDIQAYQIKKFIGSYIFIMNGVDAITFTAGIGENSPVFRTQICEHLEFLGTEIDEEKNKNVSGECIISTPKSRVKILVIPTNEELMIAREATK